MDYAFERDWQLLLKLMEERFGEQPDLTSMIFAVGLQECGQGYGLFKKDTKVDIMHVGVCTLLIPFGYYEELGTDEDGWPHFRQIQEITATTREEQELMMRRALVDYFQAWIDGAREGA
jgi:hypothetical protein